MTAPVKSITDSGWPPRRAATVLAVTLVAGSPTLGCGGGLAQDAVKVASSAWGCPMNQIEIAAIRGENRGPPPPDVPTTSPRLTVWEGQADPDARTYDLSGCGKTGTVRCTWVGFPNRVWTCRPPAAPSSTPAPAPSVPCAGTGCAKDTDCKGDRICAQGQCADPVVRPASAP